MSRLDEIKDRLAKAAPGPWTGMTIRRWLDGDCLGIVREHADGEHKSSRGAQVTLVATLINNYTDSDTAVMLLHSREDLEYLLAKVERLTEENARRAPVPAPHPDPASLERENTRLNEKLRAFTQTAWDAQAQVDDLLKRTRDLETENAQLARENSRLTQVAWEAQRKVEVLEAENKALRASGSEIRAIYEEKLERYRDLADNVADELEKLGFNVFAPGHDACDND